MKKIFLISVLTAMAVIGIAQDTLYNTPKNGWVFLNPKAAPEMRNGFAVAQTLGIPTGDGAPNRLWHGEIKQANIYYDSTGGAFYIRNPRDNTWSQVTGSGGAEAGRFGIEDSTGVQNRYNNFKNNNLRLDSLGTLSFYSGDYNNYIDQEAEMVMSPNSFNIYTQSGENSWSGIISGNGNQMYSQRNVGGGLGMSNIIGQGINGDAWTDNAITLSTNYQVSGDNKYASMLMYPDSLTIQFKRLGEGFVRNQVFSHPTAAGTYYIPLSVNGNFSDSNGNITISGGGDVSRFAIEDSLALQDRRMNMQAHNFVFDNFTNFIFSNEAHQQLVAIGNGAINQGNMAFIDPTANATTQLTPTYIAIGKAGGYSGRISAGNLTNFHYNDVPNADGTFAISATVNGTTYNSDANGNINLGTISGGGSGGSPTLQQAFDSSIAHLDNPIINVAGNTLSVEGDGTQATLKLNATTTTNNDQKTVAEFSRLSSGLAAIGLAGSLDFLMSANNSGSNTTLQAGRIGYTLDDVNMATYKSRFQVYTTYNNTSRLSMEILPTGQLKLPNYNTGVFTATPVYALGVSSDGTVVQMPPDSSATGPLTVEIDTTIVASHTTQVTIPHGQAGQLNQVPSVQVDNSAAEDFSITSDATNIILRYPIGFSGSVSYHIVINTQ